MSEHPYQKLKHDYDHLLGATWDLFKLGLKKEGKLETAVANAWKQFDNITDIDDIDEIKVIAEKMRDFMAKTLEVHNAYKGT
jgi:hypothetical protein